MDNSLKTARIRLGTTQEKMAELLGITRNYLAQIEMGRRKPSRKIQVVVTELVNNSSPTQGAVVDNPDFVDKNIDWKKRALLAESKLAALRQAFSAILGEF